MTFLPPKHHLNQLCQGNANDSVWLIVIKQYLNSEFTVSLLSPYTWGTNELNKNFMKLKLDSKSSFPLIMVLSVLDSTSFGPVYFDYNLPERSKPHQCPPRGDGPGCVGCTAVRGLRCLDRAQKYSAFLAQLARAVVPSSIYFPQGFMGNDYTGVVLFHVSYRVLIVSQK